MWVRHQIYWLPILVCYVREKATVKWLLWQETVAEVLFSRHDIHINGLWEFVQEELKSLHHLRDVLVNLLVNFIRSVGTTKDLIHFRGLNHGITCDHHSLNLGCQKFTLRVWKLSSQKFKKKVSLDLTSGSPKLNSRDKSHKFSRSLVKIHFLFNIKLLWYLWLIGNACKAVFWDFEIPSSDGLPLKS